MQNSSIAFEYLYMYLISLARRQGFLSSENNVKNLDPSYNMDLGLWDCLERVKLILLQNFIRLFWMFVLILVSRKPIL